MKKIACATLAILLSGCVSAPAYIPPPPVSWHKDGASNHDLQVDAAACRMALTSVPMDVPVDGRRYVNNCLVANGWTATPIPDSAQYH